MIVSTPQILAYGQQYARHRGDSAAPELWPTWDWPTILGPTGETLRDVAGRGRHATLENMDPGESWVMDAQRGWVVETYASPDRISVAAPIEFRADTTSWSVFLWLKTTSASGYFAGTGSATGWFMRAIGGKLRIAIDDGVDDEWGDGTADINDGQWHHIGITLQAGGAFLGWVDGVQDVTLTTGSVGDLGSGPMWFGGTYSWAYTACRLGGMSLYDRCLSPAEVGTLYRHPECWLQRRPIPRAAMGPSPTRAAIIGGEVAA